MPQYTCLDVSAVLCDGLGRAEVIDDKHATDAKSAILNGLSNAIYSCEYIDSKIPGGTISRYGPTLA